MLYCRHMINNDGGKAQKDVGETFKKAREAAGMTQADVANASGINVNYYAQIERGDVNTSVEKIQSIMKVLKIKTLNFE